MVLKGRVTFSHSDVSDPLTCIGTYGGPIKLRFRDDATGATIATTTVRPKLDADLFEASSGDIPCRGVAHYVATMPRTEAIELDIGYLSTVYETLEDLERADYVWNIHMP
jgi:hypothetical protein